jgi:NAD(P)-dependent dehydrogenase (short-subunit alcohol dehydrogenase family)
MNRDAAFQLPDITDQRVIVTGASSGIGLSAARSLAAAGAEVTLAVRDAEKGSRVAESISGSTEVRVLDLASLASVREFAAAWQGPIDVLINNAGVMATPLGRTQDGFELQFGTNHLGHFALTNLLLPQITGRVVTVSSIAHRQGKIDFDDLNWERRRYSPWGAYGQSKLANLLFMFELQRRLALAGSDVISVAAHPGYAATNLQSSVKQGGPIGRTIASLGEMLLAQSAGAGAQPTLYAGFADIPGGSFAGPDGFMQMRGAPHLVTPSRRALSDGVGMRLWRVSEELTGTKFPL